MGQSAVMMPASIMSMAERGRTRPGAPTIDLNAPPPPPASRIVPNYAAINRSRAVLEASGDPMDNPADVATPGTATPDTSGKSGLQAQLADVAAHLVNEKMSYAERKKALLQLAKLLDDEAKVEGETPAEEPPAEEPANPTASEEPETPAETEPEMPAETEPEHKEDEEPEMEESIRALKDSADPKDKEVYEHYVAMLKEERSVDNKLDALKAKVAKEERIEKARKICQEHKVQEFRPITDELLEEVASANSERGMKAIVQDKLSIISRQRPTSTPSFIGGGVAGGDITTDQFFEQLTRGVA